MADLAPPSARAALDELVHQFADPYAFVRELVQNAIDAGSAEVEVDVRYEASASETHGAGVVTVHVDDWGEGMTREVIEKKLTRLFSSSKAGDRTKIGKFGIGFVSVFSLDPDAVCIDTSRDGQSWRVLFKADRTFELLSLPEPVDGTKIRVIKRGDAVFFAEVRERCEKSLRYWCRHVEADVRFSGASIRESFGLPDAPCRVESNDGLTHLVVGHQLGGATFRGYYNHGLTLFESDVSADTYPIVGIAFKASAPRLEHTLTRDAVIEDQGFHAVMREIVALVDGPLAEAVFERLEREATQFASQYIIDAAKRHAARRRFSPTVLRRRFASAPSGAAITIGTIQRGTKESRVLLATARTPLSDALEERGFVVAQMGADDPRAALMQALAPDGADLELVPIGRDWCRPGLVDAEPGGWRALRQRLHALLRVIGAKVADIVAGDFDHPDSSIADRIAVTQPSPGALLATTELENLTPGLFTRKHTLVVNVAHPSVRSFLALAQREPDVAAYLCLKAFRLGRGLDDDMDTTLIEHVVGERWPTTP
jgi:hypothetical protein